MHFQTRLNHSRVVKVKFTMTNKEKDKKIKKGGKVQITFISRAALAGPLVFGQPGQKIAAEKKEDGRRRRFFLSSGCPLGPLVAGQPGKIGFRLEGSWPVCTSDAHL